MRALRLLQITSGRRAVATLGTARAARPCLQRRTYLESQSEAGQNEQNHLLSWDISTATGSTSPAQRCEVRGRLQVKSPLSPSGDQPKAIKEVVQEFRLFPLERRFVTLAGATGTGKTFVMAHVIAELNCPAMILCHSKVLAQQQYSELKGLFPDADVRLFESPFMNFSPRSVDPDSGKLIAGKAAVTDIAASEQRQSTLQSLLEDTSPSLVIVATVAALFSFSSNAHLPLTAAESADVCEKIMQVAERRLRELSTNPEASRNLKKMVSKDTKCILDAGNCPSLYEKYGAYLPHRVARTSIVDELNLMFGCDGWLAIADESHQMLRSIHCVSEARNGRLASLMEWGFQLPGGADKGCFSKQSFMTSLPLKTLFVSATPAPEEQHLSTGGGKIVQMVIRPSNIVDPKIEVVPYSEDHFMQELLAVAEASGQVLINCRTHRQVERILERAEEALPMLQGHTGHLKYTMTRLERAQLLHKFNVSREVSVLGGVGMLAEGLSFPHVNLVVVMDANTGGLFRTEEKLTQFAGRATRNPDARVLFYVKPSDSDKLPSAVQRCIEKSERRRRIQVSHNAANGNIPHRTVLAESMCVLSDENTEALAQRVG